ncbi:MAG: hypothetical protein EOM54_08010 [Clostridia bacterium]|nr:hypothetical protein [Clostridia bacterium]
MRKLFANLYVKLKSNSGSGIITVLVTMLFITALGATLLFTSYTGYLIKVSERGGKDSFYSASTAMDEIKAGIQQAVTESLATAYTEVLSEYNALYNYTDDTAIQTEFSNIFINDLMSWPEDGGDTLFVSSSEYYVDKLSSFVSTPPTGATVSISGDGTVTGDGTHLRLEGVSVTYTSPLGYESTVTTDIIILMPDFNATSATIISSELSSFAIIADESLSGTSGSPFLTGNAYAGSISLAASGNTLSYMSGTLVCAGNTSVSGGALLQTGQSSEFWSGNITLGWSGSIMLNGRTFVADDLTFSGNSATAVLKGSYYGFGNGFTVDVEGNVIGPYSNLSSAIVINGKNSSLDIDELDRLVLAGVSFVNATGSSVTEGGSIRTGESVSVKSDQLAYLVDESCITISTGGTVTGTNPCIFTGDSVTYSIDTAKVLWAGKTLSDYGVSYNSETGAYNGITPVLKNLTGDYKMAYFFINFSTQEAANAYFKDFFTAHPEKIAEYLSVYADLSDAASLMSSAGNILYTDSGDVLTLAVANGADGVEGRYTQFTNRCQTLNPSKGSAGDTPYSYFVDEDAINAGIGSDAEFTLPDGDTSSPDGRIINGNYTVASGETANVIIATGDVIVSSDFSGLIIAGGNITINANVTYAPDSVEDTIYHALDIYGNLLSSYLRNTVSGGEESTGIISSWDLGLLVSYDNWLKN